MQFVPGRSYRCKFTKEIIFVIAAKRPSDNDPALFVTITIMMSVSRRNSWMLAEHQAVIMHWEEIARW